MFQNLINVWNFGGFVLLKNNALNVNQNNEWFTYLNVRNNMFFCMKQKRSHFKFHREREKMES